MAPGDPFTDKECPECGALMHPNPTPIEEQIIRAHARRLDEGDASLDPATRELKTLEAEALVEGPPEKQMKHFTEHRGLKELLRRIGEVREVDDPHFVIVWRSPHEEDDNLPWIWQPEAFVAWFNDVMVSQGQPSPAPRQAGQWADAARELQSLGFGVHVC